MDTGCLHGVQQGLPLVEWMDAAAEACYPGSKRNGVIRTATASRTRPAFLDLPPNIDSSCWSAVVSQGSTSSTIHFELIDTNDHKHQLGALTGERSVLPGDGPFCSISARFRGVVAAPASDVSVTFQLAWYADAPGSGFAQ